jgi:type IV pilus assembly protein PilO
MALELGLDQLQTQFEKVARLPKSYRVMLIAGLVALVLGAYTYAFYMPARQQRAAVEAQERDLERQVGEVRALVDNLPVFEEELTRLEDKLKRALRQLPDSKELPVLLTDVSSLGKNAGLEVKAFRPHDEIPRDFYAEVPIEIEFSGGYHDIARFFDRVAKLPRIVNVGHLEMGIADQGLDQTVLRVRGEMTTFRFIDHEAANAAEPANAPKKANAPKQAKAAARPKGGRS